MNSVRIPAETAGSLRNANVFAVQTFHNSRKVGMQMNQFNQRIRPRPTSRTHNNNNNNNNNNTHHHHHNSYLLKQHRHSIEGCWNDRAWGLTSFSVMQSSTATALDSQLVNRLMVWERQRSNRSCSGGHNHQVNVTSHTTQGTACGLTSAAQGLSKVFVHKERFGKWIWENKQWP